MNSVAVTCGAVLRLNGETLKALQSLAVFSLLAVNSCTELLQMLTTSGKLISSIRAASGVQAVSSQNDRLSVQSTSVSWAANSSGKPCVLGVTQREAAGTCSSRAQLQFAIFAAETTHKTFASTSNLSRLACSCNRQMHPQQLLNSLKGHLEVQSTGAAQPCAATSWETAPA